MRLWSNLLREYRGECSGGHNMVRPEDLPLAEIYQCDPERDLSKLCVRDLAAGEMNGW